eukprot:scaffold18641_cov66-Phaeocystis_antarctica.AAC.3
MRFVRARKQLAGDGLEHSRVWRVEWVVADGGRLDSKAYHRAGRLARALPPVSRAQDFTTAKLPVVHRRFAVALLFDAPERRAEVVRIVGEARVPVDCKLTHRACRLEQEVAFGEEQRVEHSLEALGAGVPSVRPRNAAVGPQRVRFVGTLYVSVEELRHAVLAVPLEKYPLVVCVVGGQIHKRVRRTGTSTVLRHVRVDEGVDANHCRCASRDPPPLSIGLCAYAGLHAHPRRNERGIALTEGDRRLPGCCVDADVGVST